jgi:hypothetical protein
MTMWAVLVSLSGVALSCSARPRDLPDDRLLVSENFRYHARADAALDPTIMDRLEAHRTEFNTLFGVANGIIDYYLFRDQEDLTRSSGCPIGTDGVVKQCQDHRKVYAFDPFQEHELVHAFLEDTGKPSNPIVEGAAQFAACLRPQTAAAVSLPGDFEHDYYSLGQRLVAFLMTQGSVSHFVDYYRSDARATDLNAFAAHFQTFWGQPLDVDALGLNDPRFRGSACACRAPSIPTDGTATALVPGQDYRVLHVAEDSLLQLSSPNGSAVLPGDCSNSDELPPLSMATSERPKLTLGRLGAGTYAVRALPDMTGTAVVTSQMQPFGGSTCEAAAGAPVDVGDRELTLWIDRKVRGSPTFLALVLHGPQFVSFVAQSGVVAVCPGGCPPDCTSVPAGVYVAFTPPADGRVTVFLEGGDTTQDAVVTIQ